MRFLSKDDIVIDQDGHACLAGFGLLTTSDFTRFPEEISATVAGTARWMSPERLDPDQLGLGDGRATKESDCYALGMVILEVLTGQVPFPYCNAFDAMGMVLDREHPERPEGPEAVWFTDDLWGMLEQCWSPQPEARPTAEAILEHLERGSMAWKPLAPTADDSE